MGQSEEGKSDDGTVGSRRHTLVLCAILMVIAAAGYVSVGNAGGAPAGPGLSGAALYLPLLAAEWGLFYYVRMGVRNRGRTLRGLISARPLGPATMAFDFLLGLALFAVWLAAEYLMDRAFGAGNSEAVRPLLVRHAADIPLWILLALSAGFVEELTFRGYLQRQFGALLGSKWLGVAAQALLFGVTHGYQGGVLILKVTIFGLLFGAFAHCRRSLIPGMLAHGAVDVLGGLAAMR